MSDLGYYFSNHSEKLPDNLVEFVLAEKRTIFIPNILANNIIEIICRSATSKRFINISTGIPSVFYNIGGLSKTRHFTDKIIICEGTADCEYIKHFIYSDVLACLTDSISSMKLEVLKSITNHVVLSFDNDESGKEATIRESKKLKKCGFFVEQLSPPPYLKDFGDMFECV